MIFPISDDDRDVTTVAFVTYGLLVINVLLFIYQLSNPEFTYGWSVIPKEITTGEDLILPQPVNVPGEGTVAIPQASGPPVIWLTLLTSMFMHAGFGHLAGNMLYLWIFGDNVEHRFGHVLFLVFYLSSGIVGSLAQIAINPNGVLPNLGASGAIAGVLGAYLVLFPRNKVNAVFFFSIISVPAIFALGLWGAMQLVNGFGSTMNSATGGVAYMAHIGGFVTGLIAGAISRSILKVEPDSVLRRNYERDPAVHRIW